MSTESKLSAIHGRIALLTGIAVCGVAVAMGAFGAHALESAIGNWYAPELATKRLGNWHTAVQYQFFHGIALIGLGLWRQRTGLIKQSGRSIGSIATFWLLVAGILLFSGGLFAWVLSANKLFVMVVPVGGVCFLFGWLVFFLSVMKDRVGRS